MVSYLLTFQPVRRLEAYEAFNLVTFYPFLVVQIGTNITQYSRARAMVVVNWSECLNSALMMQVRIPLKSTIFLFNCCYKE